MKAVQNFTSGEYLKGLKQLAYINPIFEAIGGLLGDSEAGTISTAIGDWSVDLVSDLSKWITDSLASLVDLGSIKDAIKGKIGEVWNWVTGGDSEKPSNSQAKVEPVDPNSVGLAEGGVVTQPIKALVGEAGKEAVVPLDKYPNLFDEKTLKTIAANTNKTNEQLANLASGFTTLARALEKLGVAVVEKPATVVNNVVNGSQQRSQGSRATSAQMAGLGNPDITNFRSGIVESARLFAV